MRPSISISAAPLLVCAVIGTTSLLAGCPGSGADSYDEVVDSLVDAIIIPGFAEFAGACEILSESARTYCDVRDPAVLQAARDDWRNARGLWKQQDVFAFGPYSQFPDRFGSNIDFHPMRPEQLQALIAGNDEIDAARIAGLGATGRGLPAVEFLLFSDEVASDDRRCSALIAAGEDLAALAQENLAAWDPASGGFARELTDPGGEFADSEAAAAEILSRVGFLLENMRADSLLRPLGGGGEQAQPEIVTSRFSQHSIEDLFGQLNGVERVFEGGPARIDRGLATLLRRRDRHDLIEAFRDRIEDARAALRAIDAPLQSAVVSDPARVRDAVDALGSLQRLIQADIANALAATLTFNDADGD